MKSASPITPSRIESAGLLQQLAKICQFSLAKNSPSSVASYPVSASARLSKAAIGIRSLQLREFAKHGGRITGGAPVGRN